MQSRNAMGTLGILALPIALFLAGFYADFAPVGWVPVLASLGLSVYGVGGTWPGSKLHDKIGTLACISLYLGIGIFIGFNILYMLSSYGRSSDPETSGLYLTALWLGGGLFLVGLVLTVAALYAAVRAWVVRYWARKGQGGG